MHDRSAGRQRLLGIHYRGQRLEIRFDERRRVLGAITALGHDDGEGLTHMPHLVGAEQGLLRIEDVVLHAGAPLARQADLMIGDRRQHPCELDATQHMNNSRHGGGTFEVDRPDAGMRQRAAHQRRMQHARQNKILDILSMTEQQPAVLASQHGPADEGLPCLLVQVTALPASLRIACVMTKLRRLHGAFWPFASSAPRW